MFHCGQCGSRFKAVKYPKECHTCGMTSYSNPKPVAVALVPVIRNGHIGLLVGRRSIEPSKGFFGLPGGYIEDTETAEEAASRELDEEMAIVIASTSFRPISTTNSKRGSLLVFCESETSLTYEEVLKQFNSSLECSEMGVIFSPTELAFPYHTEIATAWFKRQ